MIKLYCRRINIFFVVYRMKSVFLKRSSSYAAVIPSLNSNSLILYVSIFFAAFTSPIIKVPVLVNAVSAFRLWKMMFYHKRTSHEMGSLFFSTPYEALYDWYSSCSSIFFLLYSFFFTFNFHSDDVKLRKVD